MGKLYNLARMTTATTGTGGTLTLGSAVSGFLTFALAGVSNGETISYGIKDGAHSEAGTGTYTSAGTTLTRSVTKSTNSDTAINLSGSAEVFITPRKEDLISINELASDAQYIAASSAAVVLTPSNLAALPSFAAHKNGSDQTGVTQATYTKITFGTEDFDVGSYFASSTWTPPSGKYRISAALYFTSANGVDGEVIGTILYKNGAEYKSTYISRSGTNAESVVLTCLVSSNGTDTWEIYGYGGSTAAKTVGGGTAYTYFTGEKIA